MDEFVLDLERYVEDVRRLVDVDSGSRDVEGLTKVAGLVEAMFAERGWRVDRKDLGSATGPGLEITNGDHERFSALLVGHMDTVFPRGTAAERPFRRDGDRAYGPGVSDMKGALVALAHGLADFARRPGPALCVAFNPDEEIGSVYSAGWLQYLARRSDCVLVCEAARPNGDFVNERKGGAEFALRFAGRASHAGSAHAAGASAIGEAAAWVTRLHGLTDYDRGTTLNVGTIEGGTAANVVAAQATMLVDLRVTTMDELARIRRTLQSWAGEPPAVPGVRVTVDEVEWRPPMARSAAGDALCRRVEAAGAEAGYRVTWTSSGGCSDGNRTAAEGAPTVDGLGPVGGEFHNDGEWLDCSSVERCCRILRTLLAAMA